MKRSLVAIMLIVALALPAFGQSIGSTWLGFDPYNYLFLPSSIPNAVSNGLFADEVDYIFRSPVSLADYAGYSVYTAYGNYGSSLGPTDWTNPFVTQSPSSGNEIGFYQLGATFPLLGFRAGALLGHQYTISGNITGGNTFDEASNPENVDAFTVGTLDYSTLDSYTSTDKRQSATTALVSGVSLGDLGISFLFINDGVARELGGAKSYTWTAGTDAAYLLTLPGNTEITSETLYVGYGEQGKPKAFGGDNDLIAKAVGQYKLGNLPLIASIGILQSNNGLGLARVKTDYARTEAYSSFAGGASTVADVNSYSMSYGTDRGALWSMSAVFPAHVNEPATPYIDPSASKNTSLGFNLNVGAEPVFAIDETLSFKTKALLALSSTGNTVATLERATSNYSEANTAATNTTWAYSFSDTRSETDSIFGLGMEMGGVAELKDPSGFITLNAGLFLNPSFSFASKAYEARVISRTRTFVDSENVNPITLAAAQAAANLTAAAALIGDAGGQFEGSSTFTSTETWTGKETTNDSSLIISLPTAVKLSLKEGKYSAIFGYTIYHTARVQSKKTPDSRTATAVTISDGTATVFDSGNATHYPAGASLADTVTTAGTNEVTSSSTWSGTMAWAFRWVPTESLTIDLTGSSIMTALDGIGFNDFRLDDILANVQLSATFRF